MWLERDLRGTFNRPRQTGARLPARQMQIPLMRKGPCAETPSVIHNDRDWPDFYRAAAMEFDRNKLPASIDVAEKAIQQRLRRLPIAHSKEHRKLKDALNSLAVLKRMV
jgi:hypothetical protein